MSEKKQWVVLNLQAIAGENDLLGRQPGEALWPDRFDLKYLARRRAEMGSRAFISLYQGSPQEATGNVFKRSWWQFYRELPSSPKRIIISLDSAFKTTSTADFSAYQVWAEFETGYLLLFASRARCEYPELRRILLSLCEQWKPIWLLVEDAASGQSIAQDFRENTSLPIKAIRPDRDKISRAEAVTPLLEAGRVFLPADAPWLQDYLDELSSFPNGTHDDQVDATTQALNFLRGQNSVLGVLELMRSGWDGFVNLFHAESPRPIAGKEATLEVEKQIRGLKSTAPDAWKPEPLAPCEACGSTCVIFLSGFEHCNECQHDRWPTGKPAVLSPNRKDFLTGRIRAREFKYPGRLS